MRSLPRTCWQLPLGLAGLLGLMLYLVPPGSYPVGHDVFWNLLVARSWAAFGFPETMPQAAFTPLATAFADRQLAFDGLLALVGGRALTNAWVPPLLWGMIALQAGALFVALRLVRREASPLWLLVLPAVSQAWLFRCTELRDMLLGLVFLLPLLAVTAARAQAPRPRPVWLLLLTAGFGYSHGALLLAPLLWALGAFGSWLERGRTQLPWRDGLWVLGGAVLATVARPDFPANVRLLAVLNFGLPVAMWRGEIEVVPSEFLPLSFGDLVATEWTALVAAAAVVLLALRAGPRRWSLLLPGAALFVAALLSRRMFELAAPVLLLNLAAAWPTTLRLWQAGLAYGIAWLVHVPIAEAGAQANRVPEMQPVADWLRARAVRGDVAFVTDWAASSPLAWYTAGSGLRFTGVTGPEFLWAGDRGALADWMAIKRARAEAPLELVRQRFGARFLVFAITDAAAGDAVATTANHLRAAMARAREAGQRFEVFVPYPDRPQDPRNWVAVDLAPK